MILNFMNMIFNLIILILFIELIKEGLKELKKIYKGFKYDMDFIGFGFCFIGLIILYCMFS